MSKIDKLKKFLQENCPNMQAFNTRNIAGDFTETVYNHDGIIVDWCDYYSYIEIFGLTNKEFEDLIDEDGNLKTFYCSDCPHGIKEKAADELFAELGYKLVRNDERFIKYRKPYDNDYIVMDKETKDFIKSFDFAYWKAINMQELQAINKKCKELGWLDK